MKKKYVKNSLKSIYKYYINRNFKDHHKNIIYCRISERNLLSNIEEKFFSTDFANIEAFSLHSSFDLRKSLLVIRHVSAVLRFASLI